jgi:hydantoinase/carbamoylase family amidase
MNDIDTITSYNQTPGKGFTRFSYSEEDRMARKYLIEEMERLGLTVKIDSVGNIRGRLEGVDNNAKPILVGSHIDTVLHGGKFDGLLGVVCALEVVRVIKENNAVHKNPIEVIVFSEEEGSNFGSTMAGSKAMVGKYNLKDLNTIKNDEGKSMFDLAKGFGLNPEKVSDCIVRSGDIKAMLEIHIEQGVVLDYEGISIGVVERIAGIKWVRVYLKGLGNHAGATPMHLRKDPLVAASKIISELDRFTREKANKTTVCTVGRINCSPNVSNAIPETISFTVDIRDVEQSAISLVFNQLNKLVLEISEENRLESDILVLGEADAIKLSEKIVSNIEEATKELGIKYKKMNSGAAHDSSLFGDIADVGMIFVPSINGRSHVPEENTLIEDIKIGCDVLLKTIIKISNE